MKAKCHNYSGCLKAYRGEEIELPAGAPLICPECAKPLTPSGGGTKSLLKVLGIVVVLAGLAAGAYFKLGERASQPSLEPKVTGQTLNESAKNPQNAQKSAPQPERPLASTPTNREPEPAGASDADANITAPAQINLDLGNEETKGIKASVLTRIDLMPDVSQTNKDKLYASVERARRMGKVLTIPFPSGKIALTSAAIQSLKSALEVPGLTKLRDDPTAVFVILGYADAKGDKQKNIAISQARADAVLGAMREKCGVVNVMHSVAMGGSTLADPESLEKNRIVEVWAVLP